MSDEHVRRKIRKRVRGSKPFVRYPLSSKIQASRFTAAQSPAFEKLEVVDADEWSITHALTAVNSFLENF
jgi:hypothetical protein